MRIGTDIVEVSRVKTAIDRTGKAFLERVYTETEIGYCELGKSRRKYESYAARFAAKEAFSEFLDYSHFVLQISSASLYLHLACQSTKSQNRVLFCLSYDLLISPPMTGRSSISAVYSTDASFICPAMIW